MTDNERNLLLLVAGLLVPAVPHMASPAVDGQEPVVLFADGSSSLVSDIVATLQHLIARVGVEPVENAQTVLRQHMQRVSQQTPTAAVEAEPVPADERINPPGAGV